jgi:hypothetical protein
MNDLMLPLITLVVPAFVFLSWVLLLEIIDYVRQWNVAYVLSDSKSKRPVHR